jgi:hypothetical protein
VLNSICELNSSFEQFKQTIDPKVDYSFDLLQKSVYYFVIENLNGKNGPVFLRTGLRLQKEQTSGIVLYWKFEQGKEVSKPGPHKDSNDGKCELGTLHKISYSKDIKFFHDRLCIALYVFEPQSIKLGFSIGSDFFAAGQLLRKDNRYSRRLTFEEMMRAKEEKRRVAVESQFDVFFKLPTVENESKTNFA